MTAPDTAFYVRDPLHIPPPGMGTPPDTLPNLTPDMLRALTLHENPGAFVRPPLYHPHPMNVGIGIVFVILLALAAMYWRKPK